MKKVCFFRSIQLKFILIFILLLLVAFQVIGSFFTNELERDLIDNFQGSVNDRVELISYNLEQAFDRERDEGDEEGPTLAQEAQSIISDVGSNIVTNIQVIDNQSRIIATNDFTAMQDIGKKTTRYMIQQALFFDSHQQRTAYEQETRTPVYVIAQPLFNDDENVVGVVYAEASQEDVYEQLQNINEIFFNGSVLALTVAAFIGILVARTITKPISEMQRQAQTMARGDFTQKVNVYGKDEIGQLAETFNDLNSRLKHSYATIEEERRKLSSVLSNMSDGVIATDNSGAVTLVNEAAGKELGRNPESLIGEFLLDVLQLEEKIVDISDLQESGSMIIDFSDDTQEFIVRANFSTVFDDQEKVTGFITVLSDVTEQEKIEAERREFVSNVSHELRTPLTTMKSYIEALNEGAWEDKEIAPKFLKVTQNETDRMIRMVNDLLQLSKLDANEYPLQKERTEFITYFHGIIDRFDMNVPEHITLKRELPKKGKYDVRSEEHTSELQSRCQLVCRHLVDK